MTEQSTEQEAMQAWGFNAGQAVTTHGFIFTAQPLDGGLRVRLWMWNKTLPIPFAVGDRWTYRQWGEWIVTEVDPAKRTVTLERAALSAVSPDPAGAA